jgi:hypothetical protein
MVAGVPAPKDGSSVEWDFVDAVHSPSVDGRPLGRPLDRVAALAERGYRKKAAQKAAFLNSPCSRVYAAARALAVWR